MPVRLGLLMGVFVLLLLFIGCVLFGVVEVVPIIVSSPLFETVSASSPRRCASPPTLSFLPLPLPPALRAEPLPRPRRRPVGPFATPPSATHPSPPVSSLTAFPLAILSAPNTGLHLELMCAKITFVDSSLCAFASHER